MNRNQAIEQAARKLLVGSCESLSAQRCHEKEDEDALQAALDLPEDDGCKEQGWLIEQNRTGKVGAALWYNICSGEWSPDSLAATRFARSKDAQQYISSNIADFVRAFPSEHVWLPNPPQPEAKP